MATNTVLVQPVQPEQVLYQEAPQKKGRLHGALFFLIQLGMLFAYGFGGLFFIEPSQTFTAYTQVYQVVIMALFTLVGFGLLLSTYRFGNWLGLATAIIVVAISVQLSPLIQKFWFNAFITNFQKQNYTDSVGTNIQLFWSHLDTNRAQISSSLNRITFLSVISILTVMTAVVGRLTVNQVLKLTVIFQIAWNINYFLLIYLAVIKQDHTDPTFTPAFFDVFGSTYVYLFAAFFGLIYSCVIAKQRVPAASPRNQYNRVTLVMSAVGAAFLFATFVLTSSEFIQYSAFGSNVLRFNVLWSLTGGVIGTYAASALCGKGRVGFKQAIVGTISGGVVIASAAPLIPNIGLVIMIGFIAGLFSGFYMRIIHPKINGKNVMDLLGLFGPFLLSALGGSLIVAPSAVLYYKNNNLGNPALTQDYYWYLAGWQLVYVGVTIGIAIVGGLITGLFNLCDKDYYGIGSNLRMFQNNFGLYTPAQIVGTGQPQPQVVTYGQNGNVNGQNLVNSSEALNQGNL